VVFNADVYGGNGSGGGCVQDGAFAGWRPYYPQPHCLQRKYKYGDNLGAFNSIEAINKVVINSKDYDSFRSRLETVLHPTPHVNIGGDMSTMHSPNDPLFWSHHAYIDYIWVQYQRKRGNGFSGPNHNGGSASKGDDLQYVPSPYKVQDVLMHSSLCYDYSDLQDEDIDDHKLPGPSVDKPENGKLPDKVEVGKVPEGDEKYSSKDRSNLNAIRYPDEADEEWCQRNKYDVKKVREYEGEYRQVYKELNQIEGYISPCSLWKRPSLCTPLIKKKQKLYADVPSYGRINVDYNVDVDPYQAFSNVRKRVEYCTPNVELPADKYSSKVESIVGKSAFSGAGSLKKIVGEADVLVDAGANAVMETAGRTAVVGAALAVPFMLQAIF
jgi:ASC-1-like (ASCH) protein